MPDDRSIGPRWAAEARRAMEPMRALNGHEAVGQSITGEDVSRLAEALRAAERAHSAFLAELCQVEADPVEDSGRVVRRVPARSPLMHVERARELLAAERRRLEHALAQRAHQDDGEESYPFFNPGNRAADLYQEELDEGLAEDLRRQLDALERAEQRLAAGTYGISIDSGLRIPDARLEARPTAELTADEERVRTEPWGR